MIRIIVLRGLPNKGKTSTLNLVYDMLLQNGGVATNRQPLGGDPNDFSDIVLWKNKTVAVFTMGDNSTAISNAIYDYNHQNCDVLVCALSTNNSKVRANNALSKFDATRINKTNEQNTRNQLVINTNDAQMIFNLI